MKFIISSSDLLKQLQILIGVISNNNTLPILDNFLFEINNNELRIVASDLETTMSATVGIESENEGAVAINAKLLVDMLKTFPEQPLTFIFGEGNTVEISSNHGQYTLAYISGEDFRQPADLENPKTITLAGNILATAVNKTLFATGNDEMRPVMTGVLFHFGPDGLIFVATDAHKLVKYQRTDVTSTDEAEFIMPKKPLQLLKNVVSDSDVTILYNEANAKFTFDNFTLVCRLIDGTYPNYSAVIPKENPNILLVDRTALLTSARRASIFSNKTTHQIRLDIAGSELQISAEDVDYSNKAVERLTCNYSGEDMKIGFNSRFLIEMLGILNANEVQLEMSLPSRAGILSPVDGLEDGESVIMLVMPVMLNA